MLRDRLGDGLLGFDEAHPDTLRVDIDKGAVVEAAKLLVDGAGARFLISAGIDRRDLSHGSPNGGDFGILHVFALDREHRYVLLDCSVSPSDPHIDSITPAIPGADWSEREFRDAVGVTPDGHPDPRRLMLSDDWPEGVYPLRRDVAFDHKPAPVADARPALKKTPDGTSVITFGPFFPVLEEPAQFRLFVEGETIVGCDYRGFYNHRGIEKMADSVLTYNEIPYIAERICGICGFIHSTCYCQAVEKAAGIEVPPRARYIRTILLELERVHSHLLWLGIAGHILGFDTVLMQTWRIREPVMWLCEAITGNRKTYGMNTVGGVRRDLSDSLRPRVLRVLDELEREALAVQTAIAGDSTLWARTKGVGALTPEWARQICVVGPPARASGLAIDARIDHPYAAYEEIPVKIASQSEGDTWSRVMVRVDELVESIRLIREAMDQLPSGAVLAEIGGEIPPGRLAVSVVEAPRGEAIHMVLTGGDNRPFRWRVRAPTYANLQAVPQMVTRAAIADVPIIIGSLDPCFSCTERVEALDVRHGGLTVYSHRELVAMCRKAAGSGGAR
jgi:Ni,Fe-hydrogenase III large subunit/Ni,Fe-hydrogenase III component G